MRAAEQEVPDGVSHDTWALVQTVQQQILEMRVAIGQHEETIARIAWRQDAGCS